MRVIKVGNGSNDYPGNFTDREKKIINDWIEGYCIHFFSGSSLIGDFRIDLHHKHATVNRDVFWYVDNDKDLECDTLILDAPYNLKFANKYKKLDPYSQEQFIIFANTSKTTKLFQYITRNMRPEYIIMKSWNYYVPKGYIFDYGYLCYAGGYRKPTILMRCKIL